MSVISECNRAPSAARRATVTYCAPSAVMYMIGSGARIYRTCRFKSRTENSWGTRAFAIRKFACRCIFKERDSYHRPADMHGTTQAYIYDCNTIVALTIESPIRNVTFNSPQLDRNVDQRSACHGTTVDFQNFVATLKSSKARTAWKRGTTPCTMSCHELKISYWTVLLQW